MSSHSGKGSRKSRKPRHVALLLHVSFLNNLLIHFLVPYIFFVNFASSFERIINALSILCVLNCLLVFIRDMQQRTLQFSLVLLDLLKKYIYFLLHMLWLSGYDNSNLKKTSKRYHISKHISHWNQLRDLVSMSIQWCVVHQRLIILFHIDHLCNLKSF